MDFTADVAKVKEILDKSQEILVVTHENPNADSVGSTLALYLGLTSLGKKVSLVCPDPMTVSLSNFIGVDKFKTELGEKNFVISLDYIDGSIEKVSYNIEGNKFNLVIEPRPGFEPFAENKVHFSHAGSNTQVIFTVDTIHLGGLNKLYEEDKDLYASHPIVNIDHHQNNSHYGQVNLVDQGSSSTAEIAAHLLSGLGVRLTADIATNLLNAIYLTTNNFTSFSLSPAAFEVAAVCLKAGGKRFSVTPSEELPKIEAGTTPQPSQAPGRQFKARGPFPAVSSQPANPPSGPQVQPTQRVNQAPQTEGTPQSGQPAQAPPDWLKPKIFKSSNQF